MGAVGIVDDVERERKADGRNCNLLAVGANGEGKRIGSKGNPVAGGADFAAIGEDGSDPAGLAVSREECGIRGRGEENKSCSCAHGFQYARWRRIGNCEKSRYGTRRIGRFKKRMEPAAEQSEL